MYGMEKVPPEIPYQRALILFKDGIETLILQSKYEIPPANGVASLGWVVPVPAPPEVASFHAGYAQDMFMRLSVVTRSRFTRIKTLVFTAFRYTVGGAALLTFILYILSFQQWLPNRLHANRSRLALFWRWTFVIWLVCLFLSTGNRSRQPAGGDESVSVLSEHSVGIYDVRVIRSNDSGDLISWLNSHEFAFGEKDRAAFDSYIVSDWCFVAANIRRDEDHERGEIATEGLAAPLILRFPHKSPVYPLMLTGTGGFETEVLLYLASDNKMQCDGRLTLHFAGSVKPYNLPFQEGYWEGLQPEGFFKPGDLDLSYLCKFKGTLTPAQMSQDIVFAPAADKSDYREHIVQW